MSAVKVIEFNGDRYARIPDVLRFLGETEADCLREGERETAIALGALRKVFGKLETVELKRWFS